MHMYELVIREHEMRVAKSLEKYRRRMAAAERSGDGYVLFVAARRAVDRRLGRSNGGRRRR